MNTKTLSDASVREIEKFRELKQLPLLPCFIEKDLLVADVVRAVCAAGQKQGTRILFCGGTSLSQGWDIIGRMSEDADFRILVPPQLSNNQKRHLLSAIKQEFVADLAAMGHPLEGEVKARNNNAYIMGNFIYAPRFPLDASLRPAIKLEITAFEPASEVSELPLRSILDKIAGRMPDVETPRVPIVSVQDTLADKLVSYLRRTAADRAGCGRGEYDDRLVRHIYDVHQIVTKKPDVVEKAAPLFAQIMERDRKTYGNQFPAFQESPISVLRDEMGHLHDMVTRDRYEAFVRTMVYGDTPTFTEAARTFQEVTEAFITRAMGERGDQDQGEESGASAAPSL